MNELTAKQKAFIEALPVNGWNGTKAAIAAGYSTNSAGVMAHRLLNNPKIIKELEKRMAEIVKKTDVKIAEIVAALRQFAFGGKKATNTEQLKALELLGKYKGMYTDKLLTEQMDRQRELSEIERKEAQKLALLRFNALPDLNVTDVMTSDSHKESESAHTKDPFPPHASGLSSYPSME